MWVLLASISRNKRKFQIHTYVQTQQAHRVAVSLAPLSVSGEHSGDKELTSPHSKGFGLMGQCGSEAKREVTASPAPTLAQGHRPTGQA